MVSPSEKEWINVFSQTTDGDISAWQRCNCQMFSNVYSFFITFSFIFFIKITMLSKIIRKPSLQHMKVRRSWKLGGFINIMWNWYSFFYFHSFIVYLIHCKIFCKKEKTQMFTAKQNTVNLGVGKKSFLKTKGKQAFKFPFVFLFQKNKNATHSV